MRASIFIVIAAIAALTIACGQQANVLTTNSNTNYNTTQPVANTNKTEPAPSPATETTSVGSLATPTDAYRTAYAMRGNKNLAGMKKVLSKDVIEFLTMIGEAEGKTLDDEIKTMFDKPQAKSAEVRNEKINGDRATIEYLDEKGQWKVMDFEKEGSEWKMSLPPREELKIETDPPARKPTKP